MWWLITLMHHTASSHVAAKWNAPATDLLRVTLVSHIQPGAGASPRQRLAAQFSGQPISFSASSQLRFTESGERMVSAASYSHRSAG